MHQRVLPAGNAIRSMLASLTAATFALTGAQAQEVLNPSNAELLESFAPYDGKMIAVAPCVMAVMEINGRYTCRLVNEAGEDMKTKDKLPVDIFITISGIDEGSQKLLATHCDKYGLCAAMRITGTLKVMPPLMVPEFPSSTISLAAP